MSEAPEHPFAKARRLKAEREAREAEAAEAVKVSFDKDLIPDIEPSTYEVTEDDREVDRIVDGLDIITAYRIFCGKMDPDPRGKTEGIFISCPRTDHTDGDPSAWVNTDKNTWFCGGCQEGGDVVHMVARTEGTLDDSYKHGKNFPDLKRRIADTIAPARRTPGGETYRVAPESSISQPQVSNSNAALTDDPDANNRESPGQEPAIATDKPADTEGLDSGGATISVLYPEMDEKEADTAAQAEIEVAIPYIPWREMLDPDTFMYQFLEIMEKSDLPIEFYFWLASAVVGLAVGRDAVLADSTPVTANLFICLYGPSGQGKSRSIGHVNKLLRAALPYDSSDPKSTGCYIAPMPGSPESLIDLFSRPIKDDADPKVTVGYGAVRGELRFDELQTLIGRTSKTGNPLKPILQQFYDADPHIATTSRGHGVVEAHNSFATLLTTTQPRAIRQIMLANDVDSGFANRFAYIMGHSKPPYSFGGPDLSTDSCVEPLQRIHAWAAAGAPRQIILDEDAYKRWDQFYTDEMVTHHESDDAINSRIPLLMKKMMLILSCNAKEREVSLRTVEAAIMLYPYIQATYAYLSGDLGSGERQELDNAIINAASNFFNKTGRGASPRDIIQRLGRQFPRDAGTIRRSLDDLCAMGLLKEATTKAAVGRPSTRYQPAVLDA